jgi:hypothetical protein
MAWLYAGTSFFKFSFPSSWFTVWNCDGLLRCAVDGAAARAPRFPYPREAALHKHSCTIIVLYY